MNTKLKFYRCKHCGKVIMILEDTKLPTICCGDIMEEMKVFDKDGAIEKHVPMISINDNMVEVSVGEILHPMVSEHYIEWILLKTNFGIHKKCFKPGDTPKARFLLIEGERAEEAYGFCNRHLLWKSN